MRTTDNKPDKNKAERYPQTVPSGEGTQARYSADLRRQITLRSSQAYTEWCVIHHPSRSKMTCREYSFVTARNIPQDSKRHAKAVSPCVCGARDRTSPRLDREPAHANKHSAEKCTECYAPVWSLPADGTVDQLCIGRYAQPLRAILALEVHKSSWWRHHDGLRR